MHVQGLDRHSDIRLTSVKATKKSVVVFNAVHSLGGSRQLSDMIG